MSDSERRPKKPLKVKPKVVARRSAQERAALEVQAEEQRQQRAAAENRPDDNSRTSKKNSDNRQSTETAANTGRQSDGFRAARAARGGGYMGQANRQPPHVARPAFATSRRATGTMAIKKEYGEDVTEEVMGNLPPANLPDTQDEPSHESGRASRFSRTQAGEYHGESSTAAPSAKSQIRREDQGEGFIDSDAESERGLDVEQLPYLVISSDDDETMASADDNRGKEKRHINLMPVRLKRTEHVERVVGMNTDVTSESLIQPKRRNKREARGTAQRPEEIEDDDEEEQEAPDTSKTKGRRSRAGQTVEELREEEIVASEMETMAKELGRRDDPPTGRLYLFSVPPKLPSVTSTKDKVKKEKAVQSPDRSRSKAAIVEDGDDGDEEMADGDDNEVQEGDGGQGDEQGEGDDKAAKGPAAGTMGSNQRITKWPTGKIGKLRVYKDGRTEMDWGGISMQLGVGIDASFLRTAVLVDPETKPGDTKAGSVTALGQVRGSLQMYPDWEKMMAASDK